jgi:hypothetical protein
MRTVLFWRWCVVVWLVALAQAAIVHVAAADEPVKDDLSKAGEAAPFDLAAAKREVNEKYAAARPEIQEYILWTAQSFGPSRLWLNEDAFAGLSPEEREKKVVYLAELLEEGEYGRHLCNGLAEAGALQDARLVPGLMKVAGYQKEGVDYDCRPKWMAVAALAREESDESVPFLISLVDHGNQNTRMWARAALARKSGKDFKQDKSAWSEWWKAEGGPDKAKGGQ